jgi:hypothetical protein
VAIVAGLLARWRPSAGETGNNVSLGALDSSRASLFSLSGDNGDHSGFGVTQTTLFPVRAGARRGGVIEHRRRSRVYPVNDGVARRRAGRCGAVCFFFFFAGFFAGFFAAAVLKQPASCRVT